MWSAIMPGKSALLKTTCEPGRSSAVQGERGEHADAVVLAAGEGGGGVGGEGAAEVDVVLRSCRPSRGPAAAGSGRRRPPRRRSVLPARSSIVVPTDSSQMMASLPVELSLTTTIIWSLPAATLNIVSLRVWVLPSSWPAARASMRGDVVGEEPEVDVEAVLLEDAGLLGDGEREPARPGAVAERRAGSPLAVGRRVGRRGVGRVGVVVAVVAARGGGEQSRAAAAPARSAVSSGACGRP